MARQNYSANKRQRELDKARKKKEKAARRTERSAEKAADESAPSEPAVRRAIGEPSSALDG